MSAKAKNKLTPQQRKATLSRVLHKIRPYSAFVVCSLLVAAVSVAAQLYIPILCGDAIDKMLGKGNVDLAGVLRIAVSILVVAAVAAFAQWLLSVCNNRITFSVSRDLRNEALRKIQTLPLSYLDSHPSGDIVSRMVADVDTFADGLLMGFTQLFSGILTIFGTLLFMLRENVPITLVVVCITPLSLVVASFLAKRSYGYFQSQSAVRGEQTALVNEMIEGQKVVQAFGHEAESLDAFDEVNGRLQDVSLKAIFFSSMTNPATRFVNNIVYAGVGLVGALYAVRGGITIGQLSVFLNYANQYTKPFNEISGVPCTSSKFLYQDVLRDEWRFNGFVVTDYTAINELVPHGVARDEAHAAELAANAGIEMDMTGGVFHAHLLQAVKEGKVNEETIDNAVRRILEMKFLLGIMDDPYRYLNEEREKATIMKPEFLEAARDAARKSVVLLKNENDFFPIQPSERKTVALIGPMVKERNSVNGGWGGRGDRQRSVTLFEGLEKKYGNSNVRFLYAEGCDLRKPGTAGFAQAVSVARQADVILVAAGEDQNWSAEAACRTDITLPASQRDLLKELKKTGKPIGLVLMNGRPLELTWEDENMDAILEAWYPGTMGGHAIADVIAGDYNPAGKLTMSFPRSVGQLPLYYNHKNTGRPLPPDNPKMDYKSSYIDCPNSPLYPFGYGLSYTSFEVDNLKLDKEELKKGETLTVTVDVANIGKVGGEEVVQLYIRDLVGSVTRPVKELKGFQKLYLKAGEKKSLTFVLTEEDLAFCGADMKMQVEPGEFRLWVGTSSADERNESVFTLI